MSAKKCAACGHKASDHAEGFMGAAANGVPLCHVDDHSCYVEAQARGSNALTVLDVAAYLHSGKRPNRAPGVSGE